ncbi:UbiD family decarboxylase [Geobacter sp. SVR]|uniref:UbiD family decarboxylase n=1 Tax=Geobacter sp. SVR TaxID=2495594 RepID=UPI00143EF66E|nr:UbiD family decarboxylase [Geobacter sp. SVR]BCS54247.1 3-octaprenyl-4-hydroxybenzoate carboxy-lyase [Geobacter sp. SVR]GCF85895.1 3-octaprenyl-4-hydroxybenzoate carboxy-lyase [Geobacter sp. SVR]
MGYRNLQECVLDLERHGMLRRIAVPLDPRLEVGMVQRRVYQAGGPALLFTNPVNCRFPLLGNLFGTLERTRFIFRDTLDDIRRLVDLKINPFSLLKHPLDAVRAPFAALHLLPSTTTAAPALECRTTLSQLPQIVSWPRDGGAFITLPQVYSENPSNPGFAKSNLGMYRVQLSGNRYEPDRQAGLHYQIHRGIGAHHAEAIARGDLLRVNVFVGGAPAMTVAAVMPLPEGMPELSFAGLLAGHRIPMTRLPGRLPVPAEADFCICGVVHTGKTLPEGPFGDHLGYYSLTHDFPYVEVEEVYHRKDAIWPFTTVGRPPQEDTSFGAFIHELTGPLIPTVVAGVKEVHAVDAAGVHPLLLAIASERYVPYAAERQPQELLTIANAILGQGQLSLAKYLFIAAQEDAPGLHTHDIAAFLSHVLERADWRRNLHFQTATTIDTLDYSGSGLNEGSKVVIAAAGPVRRRLAGEVPAGMEYPDGFGGAQVCLPGVLAIQGPASRQERGKGDALMDEFCRFYGERDMFGGVALIVICDDSRFTAATLNNFLWVTFTRSNPATDIYGIGAETRGRHWGCSGPLVIDARTKPFHAPVLEEDPAMERKVDELAAPGGPLHGLY